MVHIPDSLCSLFIATVEEREGRFVIEIPQGEIEQDAIEPSETYRVAILSSSESLESATAQEPQSAHSRATVSRGQPEPPVAEGEVRDVTIETVGDQGDGIAKVERGYVVIVPDARPGDEPTIEIESVQENVAFATVLDSAP